MKNKFVMIFVVWIVVIVTYLFMAAVMPAGRELVEEAATQINASANMSNFPGTLEFVESSPVWIWVIPGLVGIIYTAWSLRRKEGSN